jgi:hypothetical protein
MSDYSESLIKLTAAIIQYRKLVLKQKYEQAVDVAVDMQIMTVNLQQWTESQCTEARKS